MIGMSEKVAELVGECRKEGFCVQELASDSGQMVIKLELPSMRKEPARGTSFYMQYLATMEEQK